MPYIPELRYTPDECHALFTELFPNGWAGADVVRELAPEGWERSPLVAVFHPSPERIYEETVRIHENMEQFFASRAPLKKESGNAESLAPKRSEPPTIDQIRAEHKPSPIDSQRELRELVGMCLWDVFSDNHEVLGSDGRVVDLGSFRASAGFLAEMANQDLGHPHGSAGDRDRQWLEKLTAGGSLDSLLPSIDQPELSSADHPCYGYMDFYLGTQMVAGRADISSVYRMIFRRLQRAGCDWTYHFPRLLLIDMRPLLATLKQDESAWSGYDPSAEFAKLQEEQQRDAELAKMRADMDAAHREALEAARDGPPPTIVAAYREIFGHLPEGWPPEVDE